MDFDGDVTVTRTAVGTVRSFNRWGMIMFTPRTTTAVSYFYRPEQVMSNDTMRFAELSPDEFREIPWARVEADSLMNDDPQIQLIFRWCINQPANLGPNMASVDNIVMTTLRPIRSNLMTILKAPVMKWATLIRERVFYAEGPVAFCMAIHRRLGADGPARILSIELLDMIYKHV